MMLSVEQLARTSRRALWALAVAGAVTGVALIGPAYSNYRDSLADAVVREQTIKMTELRGLILQLDEVLTMSARMAAATGDRQWEKRYRFFEPTLDAAIKELEGIAPGVYTEQAVLETDRANAKLVEIENRAFALVDQNRLREAQAVVFSEEYDMQKRIYSRGMERLVTQLQRLTNANLKFAHTQRVKHLAVACFTFVLLVGGGVVVLRTMKQSQRALLETSIQLTQQTEELARLNVGLNRKAIEHTKDLEESRIAALNMMEDAVEAKAMTERAYKELLREVGVRKQAEELIQHMAYYDTLTELPNRNRLYDRLLNAIRADGGTGHPMGLILMDLDRFKEVNDTLGHDRGNGLLKEVGRRLKKALYDQDTVARLGGDEFAVWLPRIADSKHIDLVVEKIRAALKSPFIIENIPVMVEASLGIALYPEHGADAETLFRRADVAMYQAKRSGIGHVVYSQKEDRYNPVRLALMGELSYAIEQNELLLNYQPKIDLKSRRIIGVEGLVRWKHPRRGMIPPDQFVGPAEQTGLIHPLTQWVMAAGMRQCKAWRKSGTTLTVSVNLSARNLLDDTLPAQIAELLRTNGISVDWMTFEITESAIMVDPAHALDILNRLHEMGIRFEIDDFGTGYSSLGYLRKLPVSAIKVDKSFVIHMTENEGDAKIVRSTIDLAHNLGLEVVAEGVETQDVLDRLTEMGCDAAQGYYMSKPLSADELTRWLKHSPWGLNHRVNAA
jgi:diguanylate cyclase (GGDEF)-like protein